MPYLLTVPFTCKTSFTNICGLVTCTMFRLLHASDIFSSSLLTPVGCNSHINHTAVNLIVSIVIISKLYCTPLMHKQPTALSMH